MNCKPEELVFNGILNNNNAYPYICESCGEMGEVSKSEAPTHASTITLKYKRLVKKFTALPENRQEHTDLDEELKALLS